MIIVDSSVWIAYLRDEQSTVAQRLIAVAARERCLVGDLVLAEILLGARDERHAAQIEGQLRRFTVVSTVDPDLAGQAARHYRRMRAAGVTIRRTIDLLIGSFCIARGWPLLHQDRDFDAMERHCGLQVLRAAN
ncbi:MAG: PIN domain nuclease [Acetobacteraceae bacterium]|nr:PIN domain nuclease [Acetobacteraceae bacterium]